MTFDIFLKSNGLEDSFQATSEETVSFENRNGKKFTYLISDIERCLRVIWESKEKLMQLLGNDWLYAEDKYRSALGELFKNEEWNSVVSNLGSQTPNTVRCLELYASFRLNKPASPQLSKPEILYWQNLDPIFSDLDIKSKFEQWLKTEKSLKPKSISHYSTAISGVLSRAAGVSLFEITSENEVIGLKDKITNDKYIIELNEKGNGMYSAALNNYIAFLKINKTSSKAMHAIAFSELSLAFHNDLIKCGFISAS
jgi:hypothetical protein